MYFKLKKKLKNLICLYGNYFLKCLWVCVRVGREKNGDGGVPFFFSSPTPVWIRFFMPDVNTVVAMELVGGGVARWRCGQKRKGWGAWDESPRRCTGAHSWPKVFFQIWSWAFISGISLVRCRLQYSACSFDFSGRASNKLLLGREQQRTGPARPQPALPGAVPHRLWAVQGHVCSALSLGLRNPLWRAGLPLIPVTGRKWRLSDQLPRVCLWAE